MRRATSELNKSIDEGNFDPIGIFEKRLTDSENKGPSCEIPKVPEYQDPDHSSHDREE